MEFETVRIHFLSDVATIATWRNNLFSIYLREIGMGSHFHDEIDHNGVTFSWDLLEWDRTFSGSWG